jgi:hypothetical protein
MARQSISTGRRRLLVGVGVALVSATCATVLLVGSPTHGGNKGDEPGIIPHLVPDVGGLNSGSQSSSSAPKVMTVNPGIKLIPSAGGPVSANGGAPSGATFLPAQK